ncbi:hypothetical protein ACH5RR_023724 [Cinchona calisaya]|uniref:Uncharacterized protein n=1 Tax=Cinchona calisaya TaxID=153742 RepID=A0ABD2ZBF7_9GENT
MKLIYPRPPKPEVFPEESKIKILEEEPKNKFGSHVILSETGFIGPRLDPNGDNFGMHPQGSLVVLLLLHGGFVFFVLFITNMCCVFLFLIFDPFVWCWRVKLEFGTCIALC